MKRTWYSQTTEFGKEVNGYKSWRRTGDIIGSVKISYNGYFSKIEYNDKREDPIMLLDMANDFLEFANKNFSKRLKKSKDR